MAPEGSTRRRFLASLGVAAGGLAGCSAPGPASSDARSPSESGGQSTPESNRYARVYRDAVESVVLVRTETSIGSGQGSGFVTEDGYVVTNQHVIANASEVDVKFDGGEWRSTSPTGADAYSDIAVLGVDDVPEYAEPLDFASSEVFVGQEVLAIGHPFGLASSLSTGIVSGVNRVLPAPNDFLIPDSVQTTAAINPGNSGGPLVTMDGRVAGVVTAGGGDNIGFAIGVSLARRVASSLIEDGEYNHSYAGVRLQEVTPVVADANDLPEATGVLVTSVEPDGPADGTLRGSDTSTTRRGQRIPVGGDVILEIDGSDIPSLGALSTYLAIETSPGTEVEMTILRDGERTTVSFTLETRPPPP